MYVYIWKRCISLHLTLKNLVALVAYATVTLMSEKCDIFQKSANSRVAHTLRAKHAYFLIQFNIISLLLRILQINYLVQEIKVKYILCNGIYIQLLVASSFVYTTPSPRTPLALRAQKCDIAKSMQPTNRDIFPFFKVSVDEVLYLVWIVYPYTNISAQGKFQIMIQELDMGWTEVFLTYLEKRKNVTVARLHTFGNVTLLCAQRKRGAGVV